MPAGRPIEYNQSHVDKAKEYLALCIDEIEEYHKTRGEKSDGYERLVRVRLPTIEGLAIYLDVSRDTIYDWETKYPEFSDILEQLRAEQADRLQNNGLSGDYNPLIAKLILSARHGMREKSDVTTDDKPIIGNTIIFTDFTDEAGNE